MVSDRNKKLKQQYEELSIRRNQLLNEIENRLKKTRTESDSQFTDIADIATHNLQDELSMTVASEEIKKVKQIDDALARIDSGKYGTCVNCGCEIDLERLKVLPFATLCVKCKEKEEKEVCPEDEGYSYGRDVEFDYDFVTETEDDEEDRETNMDDHDIHKELNN